jgi:hypothetical protein
MAIGAAKIGVLAANATTGPLSVAFPVGITDGEYCLAWITTRSANSAFNTLPAGWTFASPSVINGTAVKGFIFVHRYRTGDAAPSFTATVGTGLYGFIVSWPGVQGFDVATGTLTATGSTTTMTAPTITTRSSGALVVNFYASADDQAHGTAVGATAIVSGASYITTVGNDIAVSCADETANAASSGTNTMSHASGADNSYVAATVALRAAVTVTGTVNAPLSTVTTTVAGHGDPTRGTASAALGGLGAAIPRSGTLHTAVGTARAPLGALVGRATGIRTTFGHGVAPLGALGTAARGTHVSALGATDVAVNPSLWLVDRTTGALSPLPNWSQLDISPIANQVGEVSVTYAVGAIGFDALHAGVAAPQGDVEVELWLDGNGRGNARERAILTQKQGDDLQNGSLWTFSGGFLIYLLGEVLVGPQATDTKELILDGENPGTILATIFDQVQARDPGLLAGMTRDFTTSADSNGAPWAESIAGLKYTPDTTLLDVINDLVALGTVEVRVTPGRVFRAFNYDTQGTDRSTGGAPVRFAHGSNLREASRRESSRVGESATTVLGKGAEGNYQWATNAGAQTARGRRVEQAVDVGQTTTAAATLAGAQGKLATLALGIQERAHSLAFVEGAPIPMIDFDTFDYVVSVVSDNAFERMRVLQWKLSFTRDTVTGDVVLNNMITNWQQRTEARINAVLRGSAIAGTSANTPQIDDGKSPNQVGGLTIASVPYFDAAGITFAAVTAQWGAVTTNADFTATDDIAGYLPQVRYAAAQGLPTDWQVLPQTTAVRIDFGGMLPARGIEMRVAAIDRYDHIGAWSAIAAATTASDAVAPPVPSVPRVTSYLGILRVAWDGRGSAGEAQPADFDHVEIHIATGDGFTPHRPLKSDGSLDERNSTTFIDQLFGSGDRPYTLGVYGTTYYAKLVAVDRTHNASTPSLAGSALLVQAADGDISSMSIGKLTTGLLTAVMTVSSTIRTAASGSRVELDAQGFRCYFGSIRVLNFDIPSGVMEFVGKLTAGAGIGVGQTIVIDPVDTIIKQYPDATGNFFALQSWTNPTPIFEIKDLDTSGNYRGSQILMSLKKIDLNSNISGSGINPRILLDTATGTFIDAATGPFQLTTGGGQIEIDSGGGLLDITSSGNQITIGSANNNYLLLTSSSAALVQNNVVKSFVIDHPDDAERFLVHACTESPTAGVEYEGTATIVDHRATVALPSYFETLTLAEGRHVFLQPILTESEGRPMIASAAPSRIVDGRFDIVCSGPDGTEVHWLVKATRAGAAFDPEPRRDEVVVRGEGPYRYLTPPNAEGQ